MSDYQDKIRARKRNQFQQKQQVNRLFAQRLSQGMTVAQAATTPYTVTDTDTLESIAGANGVDPTNVLDQNPELKNIQTGMVINVPRPNSSGSPDDRGGLGLPSNAALGMTTNNMQGSNYFQSEKMTTAQDARTAAYNFATPPGAPASNWSALQQPRAPYPLYAQSVAAAQQSQAINSMTNRPAQPASPLQTAQPATPPLGAYQAQYQYMSRNLYHQQIRTKADSGYLPTPGELNILEKMGFVKRDQTAGGGGYSWNKRRGGGGRGRGGGGGGTMSTGVPREPAFSTGSGSFSLVNWRI